MRFLCGLCVLIFLGSEAAAGCDITIPLTNTSEHALTVLPRHARTGVKDGWPQYEDFPSFVRNTRLQPGESVELTYRSPMPCGSPLRFRVAYRCEAGSSWGQVRTSLSRSKQRRGDVVPVGLSQCK